MARHYDGVSDYGSVKDDSTISSTAMNTLIRPTTICVWAKFEAVDLNQYLYMSRHSTFNRGWRFIKLTSANSNHLFITYFGIADRQSSTSAITDTDWHFIAYTMESGGNIDWWVDAVVESFGNMGNNSIATDTPNWINASGRDVPTPNNEADQGFHCGWDKRLTDDQMIALSKGIPSLVVDPAMIFNVEAWGNESPEPDISGNGNQITITSAIKSTTAPPIELLENYL